MRRTPPRPPRGKFAGQAGRRKKTSAAKKIAIDAAKRSGILENRAGTFALAPIAPLRDKRLGDCSSFHVLVALASYRNHKTKLCCPTLDQLAADLGIHRTTVQYHIDKLVEARYVGVERLTRKGGGFGSNQYWIYFHPLEGRELGPPDEAESREASMAQSSQECASGHPSRAASDTVSHPASWRADAACHAATPDNNAAPGAAHDAAPGAAHDAASGAAHDAASSDATSQHGMLHKQTSNRLIEQSGARASEQAGGARPARAVPEAGRGLPTEEPLATSLERMERSRTSYEKLGLTHKVAEMDRRIAEEKKRVKDANGPTAVRYGSFSDGKK
jgi:hypothetical protein